MALTITTIWLAFFLIFGEEKHWLLNRLVPVSEPTLVVVSLNCAGGSSAAAEEAFAKLPDLILFQESPSESNLRRLAAKHFGDGYAIVWGVDASIVARKGSLTPVNKTLSHTLAVFQAPNTGPIFVGSLRLSPPVFRMDYWNPSCWRDYAHNRALHRAELAEVARDVLEQTDTDMIIIGGDFNWTPDRGQFDILSPELVPASRGSGYTAINTFPLARIDQIWTSRHFDASSEAHTTLESDHRMVVVNLKIRADD